MAVEINMSNDELEEMILKEQNYIDGCTYEERADTFSAYGLPVPNSYACNGTTGEVRIPWVAASFNRETCRRHTNGGEGKNHTARQGDWGLCQGAG